MRYRWTLTIGGENGATVPLSLQNRVKESGDLSGEPFKYLEFPVTDHFDKLWTALFMGKQQ